MEKPDLPALLDEFDAAAARLADGALWEVDVDPGWGLTPDEEVMYSLLAAGGIHSTSTLSRALRPLHFRQGGRWDGHARSMLYRLQRKIGRFGGRIETVWGRGYRLAQVPLQVELAGFAEDGGMILRQAQDEGAQKRDRASPPLRRSERGRQAGNASDKEANP